MNGHNGRRCVDLKEDAFHTEGVSKTNRFLILEFIANGSDELLDNILKGNESAPAAFCVQYD